MLTEVKFAFDRDQLVIRTNAEKRPDDGERIVYLARAPS
jgi:hypothetical protein